VASDELCPCLLKVTTGINEATITLSKGATPVSTLTGSEVLFKDLQVGDYELSVEAPGYNSFQAPLRIGNNKSLTVYLLKR